MFRASNRKSRVVDIVGTFKALNSDTENEQDFCSDDEDQGEANDDIDSVVRSIDAGSGNNRKQRL